MIPPTDEYPDRIEAAVKAILGSGISAGRAELEPLAFQAQDLPRRKAPNSESVAPGSFSKTDRVSGSGSVMTRSRIRRFMESGLVARRCDMWHAA